MAVYLLRDLPSKFAGVKIGPSVFVRDPENELEVILICENNPFQVVLTDELADSK